MSDDRWAEAWSALTAAVENAAAVMTLSEIRDTVEDAIPEEGPEPDGLVRRPKPARK